MKLTNQSYLTISLDTVWYQRRRQNQYCLDVRRPLQISLLPLDQWHGWRKIFPLCMCDRVSGGATVGEFCFNLGDEDTTVDVTWKSTIEVAWLPSDSYEYDKHNGTSECGDLNVGSFFWWNSGTGDGGFLTGHTYQLGDLRPSTSTTSTVLNKRDVLDSIIPPPPLPSPPFTPNNHPVDNGK